MFMHRIDNIHEIMIDDNCTLEDLNATSGLF